MSEPGHSLSSYGVPADVDPKVWTLTVTGRVDRPAELDVSGLYRFEFDTIVDDFTCLEGWTAEQLEWGGVPVEMIINEACLTDDAAFGLAHGMDGDYACGFDLDRLNEALIALELDGDPLPVEHGGPARLVFADDEIDCFESVKWVCRLELLAQPPGDLDTARDIALSRID